MEREIQLHLKKTVPFHADKMPQTADTVYKSLSLFLPLPFPFLAVECASTKCLTVSHHFEFGIQRCYVSFYAETKLRTMYTLSSSISRIHIQNMFCVITNRYIES